jgi:hypothetical protein
MNSSLILLYYSKGNTQERDLITNTLLFLIELS